MSTGKREFTEFIDLRKEIVLHHYADLTKDRKFYIQLAEERIEDNPNDYQGIILLANEYRAKGSPQKAVEKYNYVLDNFSDKMHTVELAAIYYALGDSYYKCQDAVNAMVSFSHGIAIHKTYRDNYYGLAFVYANNKMFEAAIGILKEGLTNTIQEYY